MLEVYLDENDEPREPVGKLLDEAVMKRGLFTSSVDPEAIETLREALKFPSPSMRRGAARSLFMRVFEANRTIQVVDDLRASAKGDDDDGVRQHAHKLLKTTADLLVNEMTAPFTDPATDSKRFATLIQIGPDALESLNLGVVFVDDTYRESMNLARISFGIGGQGLSPQVQQRLLRLQSWRLGAVRTLATIRFNATLSPDDLSR